MGRSCCNFLLLLHTDLQVASAVLDVTSHFIPLQTGDGFNLFITFVLEVKQLDHRPLLGG
jgi:hypothetical protein